LEILYNYRPFNSPTEGEFRITTDVYKFPDGWLCKNKKYLIIGETDDTYVYKLLPSSYGEWIVDKVIRKEYIMPLGIHKSRLVKWIETQLSLNF